MAYHDVVGRLLVWPNDADDAKFDSDVVVTVSNDIDDNKPGLVEIGASDGKAGYYIRIHESELRKALGKIGAL